MNQHSISVLKPFLEKNQLLEWFFHTFVVQAERHYSVMNPPGAKSKYSRKKTNLEYRTVESALFGETRRLKIKGQWRTFPLSIAVTPEHKDGWSKHAAIDIDSGGIEVTNNVLHTLANIGIWAFAQISESSKHSGSHVYVPVQSSLASGILKSFADHIIEITGTKGESYPCNRDLRLPLMTHLHSKKGPTRHPLLFQDGSSIDTNEPLKALQELHNRWTPNNPELLVSLIPQPFPEPKSEQKTLTHHSKINPSNTGSVIRWFNQRFHLLDLLAQEGVRIRSERGAVCCPWHDDKNPSLAIWKHYNGNLVCKCLSRNSNCPASNEKYWDSFNIYCHINNLSASEAVRQIAEEHNLGRKREFRIETTKEEKPQTTDSLQQHLQLIRKARTRLESEIKEATHQRGTVSIFRSSCGIGKTHTSANIANELHSQGKKVAIVTLSHENATQEWKPLLKKPFIWQPKSKICTCFEQEYLLYLGGLGYTLPKCKSPNCPYQQQYEQRKGKIAIYQHNHLYLNHGELLAEYDTIIIDESIVSVLLEERTATQKDLLETVNTTHCIYPSPPARPLLESLIKVGQKARRIEKTINGFEIVEQISSLMGGKENLLNCIQETKKTRIGKAHPLPKKDEELQKQFFGKLLIALEHDALNPDCNPLLSFGKNNGLWTWSWFKRHELLKNLSNRIDSPAVLLLDGSANESIYRKLLQPWKVHFIVNELPISPVVQIVQCPKTASTRRIVHDDDLTRRVISQVAQVCNNLNITLNGGITYKGIEDECKDLLGGEWLHYGNQRGSNTLQDAKNIALISSPTVPHQSLERMTKALFHDEEPIKLHWEKKATGYYQAQDERLEAMNQLHGVEELLQSIHRARPILSQEKSTILIFSPWPLDQHGITPTQTITELAHGNSNQGRNALDTYSKQTVRGRVGIKNETFNTGVETNDSLKGELKVEILLHPGAKPAPGISMSSGEGLEEKTSSLVEASLRLERGS